MVSSNNEYIKKARKNRKVKRIIILCIFLILCGIIVITYTDIFNIKNVVLTEQNLITEDYIEEKAQSLKGTNMAFLTNKKLRDMFNDNYYISEVKMKKVYPSTLKLTVNEKNALYYQKSGNQYNILSDEMVYIESTNMMRSDNMIEIKGVDFTGRGIGETISEGDRQKDILKKIYKVQGFLNDNFKNVKISCIDISDLSDLKCYFNNIVVYLGNDEDLINKVKTAALIYDKGVVKNYIKVNFNGSPDFQ